jgi:HEPN domain-containing protein
MDNIEAVKEWIDIANEDFISAQFLADNLYPTPFELICYHFQQCVEKYLKGFLVYNDYEPPKTHSLTDLCILCEKYKGGFSQYYDKCTILTENGVQNRYPGRTRIDKETMEMMKAYTKSITDFVKTLMPELFQPEKEGGNG